MEGRLKMDIFAGTLMPDLGCEIYACQRGDITQLHACGLLTLLSRNFYLQMDPKFLRNQVSCGLLLASRRRHVSRLKVCCGSVLFCNLRSFEWCLTRICDPAQRYAKKHTTVQAE
jgi:hypothetical protein